MLMAAEARRRGAGHVRQLTILGDGAHWIWNLATAKFPEATQIVDLFHAREHLHDLQAARLHLGDQHATWVAGRSDELDDGDTRRSPPPPRFPPRGKPENPPPPRTYAQAPRNSPLPSPLLAPSPAAHPPLSRRAPPPPPAARRNT